MAIDANLIQRGLNQAIQANQPVTNLLSGFQTGQGFARNQLQSEAIRQQTEQQAALAPLQQQALEGQIEQRGVQTQLQSAQLQQTLDAMGVPDVNTAKQLAFDTAVLSNLPDNLKLDKAQRIKATAENQGRSTDNIDEFISVFEQNPSRGNELLNSGLKAFQQTGFLDDPGGSGGLASAKTEIFDNGTVINSLPDGTTQVSDPSGKLVTGEERKQTLITAREEEIGFAGKKATATEEGKLSVQRNLLPDIRSAIKTAEKQAVEHGDIETSLNASKAAMPGLTQVVTRLKSLADDATFTMTGKVFNTIAKEFGFSTKGDTSRARMVSIVDNQVLPLLKPIFGAAFTAIEGDRLRNAFLDPDSSPDSRRESLDSFLEQMQRNISTKEEELRLRGEGQNDAGVIKVDANGNRARVFADGTFEEL